MLVCIDLLGCFSSLIEFDLALVKICFVCLLSFGGLI